MGLEQNLKIKLSRYGEKSYLRFLGNNHLATFFFIFTVNYNIDCDKTIDQFRSLIIILKDTCFQLQITHPRKRFNNCRMEKFLRKFIHGNLILKPQNILFSLFNFKFKC